MDIRKYLSRKRCHNDVTDSESESVEESVVDETTTTASEPSPNLSKASKKKKAYKARLSYRPEWEKSIPGYIVLILLMECSVKFAKNGGNLHLLPGVLGLVEALHTGIMLQSS